MKLEASPMEATGAEWDKREEQNWGKKISVLTEYWSLYIYNWLF